MDRGPHGVPGRRRRPGLGSALRGVARREARRHLDGPARHAARRPRRHARGRGRDLRRKAPRLVHRLLHDPRRGVRPHARADQQAADGPLSRHGAAAAQLGARAPRRPRGARARARPRGDPPPQLHSEGPLSLRDPERQRVRLRRLRGRPRSRARDERLPAPARGAGEGARGGPARRARPREHDRAGRLRLQRLRDRRGSDDGRARGRDGLDRSLRQDRREGRLLPRRTGPVHRRGAAARGLLRRRARRRAGGGAGFARGAAALRARGLAARRGAHRRRARRGGAREGEARACGGTPDAGRSERSSSCATASSTSPAWRARRCPSRRSPR